MSVRFRLSEFTTVNLTLTALLETAMWEAKGKGEQPGVNADTLSRWVWLHDMTK